VGKAQESDGQHIAVGDEALRRALGRLGSLSPRSLYFKKLTSVVPHSGHHIVYFGLFLPHGTLLLVFGAVVRANMRAVFGIEIQDDGGHVVEPAAVVLAAELCAAL